MHAERLIRPTDPPELRHYLAAQLRRDLECLRRGAQHLRVMAWFLFVPAAFLSFVVFLYMLMRPGPGSVLLFVLLLMLLGVSGFYFSVSTYIRRARVWAVHIAIAVAVLPILMTLVLITQQEIGLHKRTPLNLMIECLYALFHIRMIFDLARCLGAVNRIHDAAALRYGVYEQRTDQPWDQDLARR